MNAMDTAISTTNFAPMNNVFERLISYNLMEELVGADATFTLSEWTADFVDSFNFY